MKPFVAQGPTVLITAAVSAPTGSLVAGAGTTRCQQYKLENAGLTTLYAATGQTAAAAQTNAVIPTAGTNQNVYPVNSGEPVYVTDMVDCFWSAACASGTNALYVTPGYMG